MPPETNLEPNRSIETALLRAIEAERTPLAPRTSFYASSIGLCPRRQVADRAGLVPPHPPDARSRFKMWTGRILGAAIQQALEADGYLDPAWHERVFELGGYRGRVDGYTATIPAIVEIKTADDAALTRYGDLPEHYLWQGLWYCLASGVPTLVTFQIGKNQGIVKHRVLGLEEAWRKKLTDHMEAMAAWWADYERTKVLPEHFHQFPWEDRWCPYQEKDLATLMQRTTQEGMA